MNNYLSTFLTFPCLVWGNNRCTVKADLPDIVQVRTKIFVNIIKINSISMSIWFYIYRKYFPDNIIFHYISSQPFLDDPPTQCQHGAILNVWDFRLLLCDAKRNCLLLFFMLRWRRLSADFCKTSNEFVRVIFTASVRMEVFSAHHFGHLFMW